MEALGIGTCVFRENTERHKLNFTLKSEINGSRTNISKRIELGLFEIVGSTDDGVEDSPQFLFDVVETDLLTSD